MTKRTLGDITAIVIRRPLTELRLAEDLSRRPVARDDALMEEVRVDRWLHAVRIYKTRTMASDACRGGHVRVNRRSVKPAHVVRIGDRVVVTAQGIERDLEVRALLERRVGASEAVQCYVDHTPEQIRAERVSAPFARDPSSGRPTKRDRRALDVLRRR